MELTRMKYILFSKPVLMLLFVISAHLNLLGQNTMQWQKITNTDTFSYTFIKIDNTSVVISMRRTFTSYLFGDSASPRYDKTTMLLSDTFTVVMEPNVHLENIEYDTNNQNSCIYLNTHYGPFICPKYLCKFKSLDSNILWIHLTGFQNYRHNSIPKITGYFMTFNSDLLPIEFREFRGAEQYYVHLEAAEVDIIKAMLNCLFNRL